MRFWTQRRTRLIAACPLLFMVAAFAETPEQDFAKRVSDYLALHKNIESKLPKLKYTGSSVIIEGHQHALAKAIRQARANAKQGDIFTPAISAELRRRALAAMQGDEAWRVEKSLEDSEPVKLKQTEATNIHILSNCSSFLHGKNHQLAHRKLFECLVEEVGSKMKQSSLTLPFQLFVRLIPLRLVCVLIRVH